jgi:hypothetical protein
MDKRIGQPFSSCLIMVFNGGGIFAKLAECENIQGGCGNALS